MSVPTEAESALRYRSVTFEFDPTQAPKGSPAEYAARLLQRTVSYVHTDVGAFVSAHLAETMPEIDPDDCPEFVAAEILRLTALLESVLEAAQSNVRHRLGLDLASTLLPRLEGTPVQ